MAILNPNHTHLTNTSVMKGSHQGLLPNLSLVLTQNKASQMFPDSTSTTLISAGKLCDDNCVKLLTTREYTTCKNKHFKLILKAKRYLTTDMHVAKLSNMLLLSNTSLQ